MERLETPLCIGHGAEDWKKPEQQKTRGGWGQLRVGGLPERGAGQGGKAPLRTHSASPILKNSCEAEIIIVFI